MPNVGSWNNRWSGEKDFYAKVFNLGRSKEATLKAQSILDTGSFYHNFGDGWGASISVRKVDSNEARSIRRKTKGFCGYDWMVNEIITFGEIRQKE